MRPARRCPNPWWGHGFSSRFNRLGVGGRRGAGNGLSGSPKFPSSLCSRRPRLQRRAYPRPSSSPCPPPPGSPGPGAFVCLGSASPAAIWECRGRRNMAPSRGQCTREPRLHLPPGPGAGQSHLRPSPQTPPFPSPAQCFAGSGST